MTHPPFISVKCVISVFIKQLPHSSFSANPAAPSKTIIHTSAGRNAADAFTAPADSVQDYAAALPAKAFGYCVSHILKFFISIFIERGYYR